MANVFLDIPQELRIQILSHLDAVSLSRCAMTCTSVYATLKESSLLIYTIQLHFDGLKDVGTSSTHSERIESLLRRRQAWLSLDCTTYTTYSMQHMCRAYEFVGGVFANTDRHHLEIAWLPTASHPEGRTLQRCLAEISIRDFTMDPAQDMIALFEEDWSPSSLTDARACRIHLRTISTDMAHPLAARGVLHFSVFPKGSFANDIYSLYIEIAKNILVVVLHLDATWHAMRVLVWDWTTSDLIVDSSIAFDSLLLHPRFEFAILNSTSCLVTSSFGSGSIRLYKLAHLINAPAIHLATLHLPPIAPHTKVIRVCTDAGPIEAQPLSQTSLMGNDEDRLHVFTMVYDHPHIFDASAEMNMFVHERVFTKYIARQISSPEDHPPLNIPWEEWGPPNTRIIYPARVDIDGWTRYIHGQRVVLPALTDGANGKLEEVPNSVEVLNFSLAAVLSAKGVLIPTSPLLPSSARDKPGTLSSSSTIYAGEVPFLRKDVETHLPYVSYKRDLKQTHAEYMIHADGIVGVNMKADGRLSSHIYAIC
ncbi:hypothetical protein BJ912DRAFT_353933 [Pholiota molesta]|nr:hypothetical protein BJ912DRAFT_353933 [Pholiota molesta]